jgi:hypothetical protein
VETAVLSHVACVQLLRRANEWQTNCPIISHFFQNLLQSENLKNNLRKRSRREFSGLGNSPVAETEAREPEESAKQDIRTQAKLERNRHLMALQLDQLVQQRMGGQVRG